MIHHPHFENIPERASRTNWLTPPLCVRRRPFLIDSCIGMMPLVVLSPEMTRRQKLFEKARNNPASVRFQELCLLAEHMGFAKRGGKGSHVVYEKEGVEEILTFQNRMGMAKSYQVKQLLAVIEKYQLGEKG